MDTSVTAGIRTHILLLTPELESGKLDRSATTLHIIWPAIILQIWTLAWNLTPFRQWQWMKLWSLFGEFNRRISNWASPRTSALKPRLSVSSHNTDARQTIERLTLSSYSACVNTENLVVKPGSAQIDVNFVNLKFVYAEFLSQFCSACCTYVARNGYFESMVFGYYIIPYYGVQRWVVLYFKYCVHVHACTSCSTVL